MTRGKAPAKAMGKPAVTGLAKAQTKAPAKAVGLATAGTKKPAAKPTKRGY
jgi:hypothetical protein